MTLQLKGLPTYNALLWPLQRYSYTIIHHSIGYCGYQEKKTLVFTLITSSSKKPGVGPTYK